MMYADNVHGQQHAVMAILYHSQSTDDYPQHQFCPDGPESWCFYNRALSKGESTAAPDVHDPIPLEVACHGSPG